MIARVLLPVGAMLPIAAGALAQTGDAAVAAPSPLVVAPLGYSFELGSMIAALCACIAVRVWVVTQETGRHRWLIDIPVSALAIMFTVAAVVRLRPDPLVAIMYGTGLGMLGASIITIAKQYVDRGLTAMGVTVAPDDPEPPTKPGA